MTFYEVKIMALQAEIQAELVRVEGMKAENKLREINGNFLAYGEADFFKSTNRIQEIANEIQSYANYC